ncbi:MAG: AEC family transporter [Acutalibacteraceae bacterium]|nr:AEC family transporter [Acutalibacteraceae bacterium]
MFLDNVLIAARQVGILYIMVIIGVVCDKLGLFTEKTGKACTDLLFYIITPCVIINSFFTSEFTKESGTKLLIALGCGFLLHFIAIAINTPLFSKGDKDENCVYKYGAIYGNVGYMTLPLTQAILGSEGVFYCSAVVMAFNVVSFTHGVFMMDRSKGFDAKKLILNPGVIAVLIGLPFYLFRISLPEIISKPVDFIAGTQTPIAMIIFGTFLANAQLKSIFTHKKIFLVALSKLIVLPAVMITIYKLMGLSGTLLVALAISSCAPSANNTVMFSAKYDKDTRLASQLVAMVSFISIITIPLIIAAVQTIA